MRRGQWAAIATMLLAALWPSRIALAWYFPEHVEITRIALSHDAPAPALEVFKEIIDLARIGDPIAGGDAGATDTTKDVFETALPLCDEPGLGLDETPLSGDDDQISSGAALPLDAGAAGRFLATPHARCIPYGALSALAADHSLTVRELMTLLVRPAGRGPLPSLVTAGMVTGAAARSWRAFRAAAPVEVARVFATPPGMAASSAPAVPSSLDRTKTVRDLDARFLMVDHDYTSRASSNRTHFHQSQYSIAEILSQLENGGVVDNALSQMLTHHIRSMILALEAAERLGGKPPGESRTLRQICKRTSREASSRRDCRDLAIVVRLSLLEHAFALHFLEDGFSAGHIGTEHGIERPDTRIQKHDYLCRTGLSVTRALAVRPCGNTTNASCWTAFGDGYLDADSLIYVAEAVAAMQVELAAAFEPASASSFQWEAGGQKWEASAEALSALRQSTRAHASLASIQAMEDWSIPTGTGTGAVTIAGEQARLALGSPLSADKMASNAATPDIRLWRPLLVLWPAARADVRTIDGLDPFGRGFAYQVTIGANLLWNAGGRTADHYAPVLFGMTAGIGVAYRFDNLLAGRDNRSVLELNVGIAPTLLITSAWHYATMAFVEVRLPAGTLAALGLGYAARSALAVTPAAAPWGIGLYGARISTVLPTVGERPELRLAGWDLEIAYLSLGRMRGRLGSSAAGLAMDPELRLRIGAFNEKGVLDGSRTADTTFSVGIEVSSGFSWFFGDP